MAHFTEPTTAYWQHLLAADAPDPAGPPWRLGYPARLPDGRRLVLPIRALASEPRHAVASLLVNQASFEVLEALAVLYVPSDYAIAAPFIVLTVVLLVRPVGLFPRKA